MSTDSKGAKILARTFYNQLRASGYNPNQIIGIATELIDLVASDLRDAGKVVPAEALGSMDAGKGLRPAS